MDQWKYHSASLLARRKGRNRADLASMRETLALHLPQRPVYYRPRHPIATSGGVAVPELTIKLLLLFFPGIVCFLIVDALIVHRARKLHELVLLSFVYGLLSYVVYAVLKALWGLSITASEGFAFRPHT